ncbi:type IV secretory system conjugative DNA transfer family protein [Nocardioides hankookensis]|uniref:Type IV secretory system conjugative DNA transfer family protein n=1 Tax=Nocardioides hankookensis TaxID=443157 RepID=A0ABW1LN08_9ACTN
MTATLSGNAGPDEISDAVGVLLHPGDPAAAWGHPIGPAVLFWGLVVGMAALVASVGSWAWRLLRPSTDPYAGDPGTWPGLAGRRQVEKAAGTKALMARAATLRPIGHDDMKPADVGFRLGRSHGVECWATVEDSVIVVGPPRQGKGLHLVINAILDAPGAVVTTSTRPDNLAATITARSSGRHRAHPVMVFDPQNLAPGVPGSARWSLVRGCEDPRVAMARARALSGDPGQGVESGSFWAQQCEAAVRCLLHAAALGEREPVELYEWSLSVVAARAAIEVLRGDPRTAPGWERALAAILDAEPRQRDSVWAMVTNTFAALADPAVLAAVSPGPGEHFDPSTFIRTCGTAYLLGTASGASATARLVATFVEDLVEAARRIAASSSNFRLDPPLTLVLDEAANYPLPSLPALMSEGGGSGICTWVFLQSRAQARARWGDDDADAIWDAAIVKVILGGGGHADDLGDLSALLGTRKVRKSSVSYGGHSPTTSYSDHLEDRHILDAAQIRRIGFGYALMVLRSAAPIMLTMQRWTERDDAKQLLEGRSQITEAMRSPSAWRTLTEDDLVTGGLMTGPYDGPHRNPSGDPHSGGLGESR